MDDVAAGDSRLKVVHVQDLPDGWFGKNNAMRLGIEQASGDWLCFTDADCVFDSPKLLSAAVSFAQRHDVAFLSVLPKLEVLSIWERIIQPVAGAIMVFWNPPLRVNSPKSRAAYANGAFMLMTRDAYQALGGHAAVKATLNEDMHFARRAKRLGVRLRVIRGGTMYRVRMYTTLGQMWRGWSRIFYGCFGTFPRLLVSVLMLAIFSISPYVTLLAAAVAGVWPIAGAGLFAVVAQQSVLWQFYRHAWTPSAWALTYPIGAVVCLGMTLNAMTRLLGRKTSWRGSTYAGGAHVRSG
jgi:glycosyltransferase involved in cell wall biosynthesis